MGIYQGWKVAVAGAGINFLVGISYAWSVYASGLIHEFGWSQAQTALPYSVFLVCYATGMVFAGRAQDVMGPRPVVIAGAFLVGGAFFVSAFLSTPVAMAFTWGAPFGIGLAGCFASVTPAAMKWFPPHRRGLIAGVVVTGVGLSALIMSPLVHLLVRRSVMTAFAATGVMLLIGILLLSRWVTNPPGNGSAAERQGRAVARDGVAIGAEDGAPADLHGSSQAGAQGHSEHVWYAVLTDRRFHLLWLMFLLSTTAGLTLATHLDRIARVQVALVEGYPLVIVFSLFNAIGRPVGGILSDRMGRTRAMTLTFTFMAAMLLLAAFAASVPALAAAVALVGLGYGTIFSLFPAATVTFFGHERFGLYYGMVFTAIGAAGLYPLVAGHLFDRFGSFSLALLFPAVFCLCAAGLSTRFAKTARAAVGVPT